MHKFCACLTLIPHFDLLISQLPGIVPFKRNISQPCRMTVARIMKQIQKVNFLLMPCSKWCIPGTTHQLTIVLTYLYQQQRCTSILGTTSAWYWYCVTAAFWSHKQDCLGSIVWLKYQVRYHCMSQHCGYYPQIYCLFQFWNHLLN